MESYIIEGHSWDVERMGNTFVVLQGKSKWRFVISYYNGNLEMHSSPPDSDEWSDLCAKNAVEQFRLNENS